MSSEPDARALRRMVGELQADAVPDLDWDRVESRLFAEVGAADATASAMDEDEVARRMAPITHAPEAEPISVRAGARSTDAAAPEPLLTVELEPEDAPARISNVPAIRARAVRDSVIELPAARQAEGGRFSRGALAVVAALAVAAGLLLGFGLAGDRAAHPVAQREPIDSDALPLLSSPAQAPGGVATASPDAVRDVRSLKRGDVVEASAGPLSFGEAGVFTWTLAPGGRLSVLSDAGAAQFVVSLESGSLSSEVSGLRGFVVQGGEGEVVASRGVVFSVTRSSRGLYVQVDRGAVSIGALGGLGERHLVEAPRRGKLAADGVSFEPVPGPVAARAASTDVRVASTEPTARMTADAASPDGASPDGASPEGALAPQGDDAASARAVPSSEGRAGSPTERPAAAPEAGAPIDEATVRSRLTRCLVDARAAAKAKSPDGVTVTVSSTLRVRVDDNGAVKAASFNPPLLPELQSCAVFLFHERLAPGARSVSIPVEIP